MLNIELPEIAKAGNKESFSYKITISFVKHGHYKNTITKYTIELNGIL